MNNDYTYCKGTSCDKQKQCKRYIGNHILEFLPRLFVEDARCIRFKHNKFDNLKEK